MSNYLEQHIKTTQEAANAIEKQIVETPNIPAKQLCKLSLELTDMINTTNFLYQMKASYDKPKEQSKIVTM